MTLVLVALAEGELRYNGIARRIAGVSQKMLTQTLRTLERDGMIIRTITPAVPVQVSYRLTPLGASLHAVVQHLKDWAEQNMPTVQEARARYDAAAQRSREPAGPVRQPGTQPARQPSARSTRQPSARSA